MTAEKQSSAIRVMVIGSGWHFTSGISHYTYRLSNALADRCATSTLLMRRLLPRRVYPGAGRVGADVTDADYPAHVPVYDGVDWYWGRSLAGALEFLDRERPERRHPPMVDGRCPAHVPAPGPSRGAPRCPRHPGVARGPGCRRGGDAGRSPLRPDPDALPAASRRRSRGPFGI